MFRLMLAETKDRTHLGIGIVLQVRLNLRCVEIGTQGEDAREAGWRISAYCTHRPGGVGTGFRLDMEVAVPDIHVELVLGAWEIGPDGNGQQDN